MTRGMLERFLDRVKNKTHLLEVLPDYVIYCCVSIEEDICYFILSENRIEVVESLEVADITIEGPRETICALFAGAVKVSEEDISFRGSFRQLLLLDSLWTLAGIED